MNARIRINMAQYVDDGQDDDPKFYISQVPDSRKTFKTYKNLENSCKNQPLPSQLSKEQRRGGKRISLDCKPFEEQAESAKEVVSSSKPGSDVQADDYSLSALPSELKNRIKDHSDGTRIITKKKAKLELKEIISRQKVTLMAKKFIDKVRRNNVFSSPIDYKGFEKKQKQSILQKNGFQINIIADNGLASLSIMQIICLFLAYTLAIVFEQVSDAQIVNTLQTISLVFYLLEIVYNSVTVKSTAGKKLTTYEEILTYYLSTNLIIDAVSVLILIVDSNTNFELMKYIRLFIVAKLPQCLQKMQKLEVFFIKNYYNQQYWSLIKVFLFNFCFAHILSIFLNAMANISTTMNWQIAKGIASAGWFEKYVWGYYWGANIMLTVGFGDIIASTYQEALCLILIEIVSVMCLAYNINWVGTLISNIRSQDLQKCKNLKTFKQLTDKYHLPNELQWKINNYIEQSVNIRKKFNIEQENSFIGKLPINLKKEYLKESNRSIFHDLTFFGSLIDKTIYAFAEKIEMHISHPQQTLRRQDDEYNLLILRQGEVAYSTKRRNCKFNDMAIDRIKVKEGQKPFLLGLQFISKKRPIYEIRSTEYSVLYFMEFENLINTLKESQMDYLHYCFLRDRNKSMLDQYEVFACEFCKSKHTKFTCPKLHFIPIQQHVIYKEQRHEKLGRNDRNDNEQFINFRKQSQKSNSLIWFKKMARLVSTNESKMKSTRLSGKSTKLDNPFLDRLGQVKKLNNDDIPNEASNLMQDFFLKNTTEIIKQEFNRFTRSESYEDEVWIIHCDKMKNFKEYFAQDNSCNLQENFNVERRMQQIKNQKSETLTNFQRNTIKSLDARTFELIGESTMINLHRL